MLVYVSIVHDWKSKTEWDKKGISSFCQHSPTYWETTKQNRLSICLTFFPQLLQASSFQSWVGHPSFLAWHIWVKEWTLISWSAILMWTQRYLHSAESHTEDSRKGRPPAKIDAPLSESHLSRLNKLQPWHFAPTLTTVILHHKNKRCASYIQNYLCKRKQRRCNFEVLSPMEIKDPKPPNPNSSLQPTMWNNIQEPSVLHHGTNMTAFG